MQVAVLKRRKGRNIDKIAEKTIDRDFIALTLFLIFLRQATTYFTLKVSVAFKQA